MSGLLSGPREKTEHFLQSTEGKECQGAGVGVSGELGIYKPNPMATLWSPLSKPVEEDGCEP